MQLKWHLEKTAEPKKLSVHAVGHFYFYREPGLSTTAIEAIDWFNQHLGS